MGSTPVGGICFLSHGDHPNCLTYRCNPKPDLRPPVTVVAGDVLSNSFSSV